MNVLTIHYFVLLRNIDVNFNSLIKSTVSSISEQHNEKCNIDGNNIYETNFSC